MPAGQDGVTTGVKPVATAGVKGYVVPEGITTLSVPAGGPNAFGEVDVVGLEELEVAEAETDVEAALVFDEFFVVVGNASVVGMASCNKHLTSSAEQRSSGV